MIMNNQKICSFYISEFHLLTILLPYINEKIVEQKEIAVILQNDISKNVKTYLKNVGNLNLDNEKIIDIGWKKSENINNIDGKDIIIIGDKNYIDEINNNIDSNSNVGEILNCYKVSDMDRIDMVLEKHSKVLKTEGKREVKNFSQNVQKIKTIKT